MKKKDMIRAEIERRFWSYGTPLHDDEVTKKVDEILDIIENALSEEPDNSLEEEYKDYVENDPVYSKLVNGIAGLGIARHFAKWGAEHLRDITKMIDKSLEEEQI